MRDDTSTGDVLLAFLVGATAGVVTGLLLAPYSGRDSRKRFGRWMEDVKDEAEVAVEKGRSFVKEQTDRLKKSVDEGLNND